MADATIEQPATGTDSGAGEARQQQLQQFLFHLQPELEALAYDTHALSIWDCEAVMSALASKLFSYDGPADAVEFERWATKIVVYEAEKFKIGEALRVEYGRVIHAAIHRAMGEGYAVDYAVEHQDMFWQVAQLLIQNAHGLMKKGTAKMSTRIAALALKHVRFYYRNKNHTRHRAHAKRIAKGLPYGCGPGELTTPQVMAAERAS